MDLIHTVSDLFLHLDDHLRAVVQDYGAWSYGILFIIIFAETGLVVTPFLPGDSLLFAAGALSSTGAMRPVPLFLLLVTAAILGDSVNYGIGAAAGRRVFRSDARILKLEYLERTEKFFEKYGGKTIVLARFIPIIRTYAPFVAGAGRMDYGRFLFYNVLGGVTWVGLFVGAGYFFGNIPVVEDNFTLVVLVIIALSLVAPVVEWIQHRRGTASP